MAIFFWPQTVCLFVYQPSLWHSHQSPKMFTANNGATELNTNEHLWKFYKKKENWAVLKTSNRWFLNTFFYFFIFCCLVWSMHVCVLVYSFGFIDWHLLRGFFFFLRKNLNKIKLYLASLCILTSTISLEALKINEDVEQT